MRRIVLVLGSGAGLLGGLIRTIPAPSDPIAQIIADVKAGKLTLVYEPKRGYLDSLLDRLKIDPSSQVLVFSKTSLQTDFITRKTPRAIYFNSDTYVGWIPGAPLIEIATVDPIRGTLLYTLRNTPTEIDFEAEPKDCNRCHGRRSARRSPELFANSVYVSQAGYPRPFAPTMRATPELPLRERWGGWYVTGTHGKQRHMGNEVSEGDDNTYSLNIEKGANITSLRLYFDATRYRTEHSDIVALMMLEFQMDVQNQMNNIAIGNSEDVESLVQAMLCVNEVRLVAPIKGTSKFAERFANAFPKDHRGRSLGDLDLQTRLLKFPCSPLIYSASFDALPAQRKAAVVRKITRILRGQESSEVYAHLSASDRKNIYEILCDTKPSLFSPER